MNRPVSGLLAELWERRKVTLMALALALIAFAAFAPAIQFQFINYDDNLYVYENWHVLDGLSWSGLIYAFTTIDVGNWMPLTWLSFELDATLYGRWAAGFHFTNIALHCSSVVLLFLALGRMTKSYWRSALVAILFAIHPLRQESVVWIAERKGALSTFFWMAGLLAYARYAETRSLARYAQVAICLVLGLMAKSMLVTFPVTLLLLDYWPLRRVAPSLADLRAKLWPLVLEKIPLLLPCIAMVAITFWTQNEAGGIDAMSHSLIHKMLHVMDNYMIYVRNSFWPVGLAIPYPTATISWGRAITSVGVFTAVSLTVFALGRRFAWLAVGWFWFVLTFVPVIGWIQISHVFVADRYTYVPFLGLAVMVAWTLGRVVERFPSLRIGVITAGVCMCALAGAINCATLFRWRDSITLFTDSIQKAPHPVACNNLASALNAQGNFSAAIPYADLAIRLRRDKPKADAYVTRGLSYSGMENYDKAIADYTFAISLDERSAKAHLNRGNAYSAKRDFAAALADFTRAIELSPEMAEAWNDRAFVWCSQSNYSAAISDCTHAIELNPDNAISYNNRGNVLSSMGDYRHAADDYSRAITLNPGFAMAYNNRAMAYLAMKEPDMARADIERCQELGGQPSLEAIRMLSGTADAAK